MFAKVKPNTQIIGQNIIYFNQVDSTNQFASELIRQNLAENGTVIVAEHQTKGRGQLGRSWESEPFSNLMFSLVLKYVTNSPSDPFIVNKFVTLSVFDFLKAILPDTKVNIKWPNDILVEDKKICGILVENNFIGHKLNHSVIGIGLNVLQNFDHVKHFNATSLSSFTRNCDRSEILKGLLENIESYYINWMDGHEEAISKSFDQALSGYESLGLFDTQEGIKPGIVKGCDKEGRLVIEFEGLESAHQHGTIKQLLAS